jgi:hypothetical protein
MSKDGQEIWDDANKKIQEVLERLDCPVNITTVEDHNYSLLQQRVREEALRNGVSLEVMDASDHDFYCRCPKCKEWWRAVGPEDDGTFGPFTSEEIRGNV